MLLGTQYTHILAAATKLMLNVLIYLMAKQQIYAHCDLFERGGQLIRPEKGLYNLICGYSNPIRGRQLDVKIHGRSLTTFLCQCFWLFNPIVNIA
jgi:hypothetical protein